MSLLGPSQEHSFPISDINNSLDYRMAVCNSGTFQFNGGPGPNTMSSEDLDALNLKPGRNKARYVCPELSASLDFSVFLYGEDDKLVVTDIDGTITESDIRVSTMAKD